MTVKKSALGKGLGALIPEVGEKIVDDKEKSRVYEIDINQISPDKDQPRKSFDEEKLEQLAISIREHGIIQPILVRREADYYKIIAGERRWRAARLAGLRKIPILEKNLDKKQTMEVSLIENLQREDLNPIEEARAYKRLIDEFNITQEDIAIRIGKSRPSISNTIRLLTLDKRVLNYLIDGTITEGHGKTLVAVENSEVQYDIAKKIIDEGLNVRQTEVLIKSINNVKNKSKEKQSKDVYIRDIENKLKGILGTKVSINKGRKKGKIEIEYYNNEDLERIIEIFSI
jgi:ParB family transcriptional regulator, chromosome partitioning protein